MIISTVDPLFNQNSFYYKSFWYLKLLIICKIVKSLKPCSLIILRNIVIKLTLLP